MPGPLAVAGIQAGGQLAGSLINAYSQGRLNKKQQDFSREMYGLERSDALADWYRQVAYNDPRAQMDRLRDAGLNPMLVYGEGVVQNAPAVRSSSAPAWNPRNAQLGDALKGVGNSIAMVYDLKLKEAQADNVRQSTQTQVEEQMLKRAQTFATIKAAGKTDLEAQELMIRLSRAQELTDLSVDMAKTKLDRERVEIAVTLDANDRAAAQNAASLKQAAENILTSRLNRAKTREEINHIKEQIELIKKDTRIKQMEIELREKGIYPGSPGWFKSLEKIFGSDGVMDKASDAILQGWGREP